VSVCVCVCVQHVSVIEAVAIPLHICACKMPSLTAVDNKSVTYLIQVDVSDRQLDRFRELVRRGKGKREFDDDCVYEVRH